ncbi:hypothetical protein [Thiocystis violacea]|uniref:hypothetical protein n=1 Tax=Thiocystis violacea TaxID=13725 RepID=UPI0019074F63|nr:hypothetical protein [Thiocystis violacea]
MKQSFIAEVTKLELRDGHSAPRDSTDVVFFSGIDSAARGWVDKVLLWYLERA